MKEWLLILLLLMGMCEDSWAMEPKGVVEPDSVYSYADMMRDLRQLAGRYGTVIDVATAGYSVEGRVIPVVKLGTGPHKVFVGASFHAREYITTNFIMYFIERYAAAYCEGSAVGGFDARRILDGVTFHIFPMINPDGVEVVQRGFPASAHAGELMAMWPRDCGFPVHRSWKANARGVDINRNFDYGWGRKQDHGVPASSGYNGPRPLSEPEAIAVARYTTEMQPEAVVALHTQGQVLYMSTPDAAAERMAERIARHTGFEPQPIEEPYGSFQDFVDHHFGVFYACVELCPYIGPRPYDESLFPEVWESAQFVLPIVADELIKGRFY